MTSVPGLTSIVDYDRTIPDTVLNQNTVKTVFLASGYIGSNILFHNGLHQNTLIIYDMLESMGYSCYLLSEQGSTKKSDLTQYKHLQPDEFIDKGLFKTMNLVAYIEIGMSVDSGWRSLLQRLGTKVIKLYLGNILNIDIETTGVMKGIYFPHHISGSLDEIWTSPHYAMNKSYINAINGLSKDGKVVPYVWDTCFIKDRGTRWRPSGSWTTMDLVIAEPNLSFQKSCLYPLLLANEFASVCPTWKGKVYLLNTERMAKNRYMSETVLPNLFLQKIGRLVHEGRADILSILRKHPSAMFLAHQYNNDYNYMTLELMELGFPVLHNSIGWKEFGYYWSVDEWPKAIADLWKILQLHASQLESYRSHAKQLQWKHSPWNPVNRMEWMKSLA